MKQIPELELPKFQITVEQLQELVTDFAEKLDAITITDEDNMEQFSHKKSELKEPLRAMLWECMVMGPHTRAKFTLSGRV
jgi:hypothetical protein